MSKFTHLDKNGEPGMVEVGAKPETFRRAVARAMVLISPEHFEDVRGGSVPKGNLYITAKLAGINAAKRTAELIPLCHPLRVTRADVTFSADDAANAVLITATVTGIDRTGFEMEALSAASVAALTIYDMIKAFDRGAEITGIRLLEKSGGKSGHWVGGIT